MPMQKKTYQCQAAGRLAAWVLMPETPMHEQRYAAAWKHQIRNARKAPIMEPEA